MDILEVLSNGYRDLLVCVSSRFAVLASETCCYTDNDETCAEAYSACDKYCLCKLIHYMFLPFNQLILNILLLNKLFLDPLKESAAKLEEPKYERLTGKEEECS